MRYIQESGITNKSVSGDRGAYGFLKRSFPKGALTHHRKRWCQRLRYVYMSAADVRSTRFCFGTSHRNGKFALAAKHRHFRFTTKIIKYCKEVIANRHIPS